METDVGTATLYKWLAWFESNRKQVLVGAVIVLLLGVIIAFVLYQRAERHKAAGHAFASAFVPQVTTEGSGTEAAKAYLQVANKYPNSKPGAEALLMAAASFFDQGKYAEAQAQFEKFAREHRDNPFTAQALLGVAASFEAQNKTDEAIKAYQNLIDRRPNEAVIPQAKYALARIYDGQNKPEKAYPLYEDVARTDPYGAVGSYAGLRAEELKAKHPNLAPPVSTPSTNVPFASLTNLAPAAPAGTSGKR